MIKLYNGDYLDKLKEVEDESVDAIITDIPYNISQENHINNMPDRTGRTGLDFGDWDWGFDEQELSVLSSKLKKGGSLIVFHAFEQYGILLKVFKDLESKDRMVWQKTNPMPRNRDRRYISNMEMASWYVKPGKHWTFNRQNENYDGSVLTYPCESGGGYKRIHPTQKPLALMENLLKRHTNPGDLVLDCFMGSGTTGIACYLNKRNFIGIERDKDYFEKTVERFKENVSMFDLKDLYYET